MLRVLERLESFMMIPVEATARAERLRQLGLLFPDNFQGQELDKALQYLYAEKPIILYYGLEDGTFIFHTDDFTTASYREPGEGGYRVWAVQEQEQEQQQQNDTTDRNFTTTTTTPTSPLTEREIFLQSNFYHTCVDPTSGTQQNCTMEAGDQYIQCIDNDDCTTLYPCNWLQETIHNCSVSESTNSSQEPQFTDDDCLDSVYNQSQFWCPLYSIETVAEEETNVRGYIPRTWSCINEKAQLEERVGRRLLDATSLETGNCYFGDGVTLVNRSHLAGEYQYCQPSSSAATTTTTATSLEIIPPPPRRRSSCEGVFTGCFRSREYDPRYRGWYKQSRRIQNMAWTEPYAFFSNFNIGITYTQPMYNDYYYTPANKKKRKEFYGVWAVDYALKDISQYLVAQYQDTNMWVVILETQQPNYVIATSTGSPPAIRVQADDHSKPCPELELGCEVIRVPILELSSSGVGGTTQEPAEDEGDNILQRAFVAFAEAGYPSMELIGFKGNDNVGSEAYVAQGGIYEQENANNLQWYVLVAMPMGRSEEDAVLPGDSAFAIVCILGSLGVVGCFLLFMVIFQKRKETAFINGDWRFTSGFILGCSALNLSTYTLLGDNTDSLCLLRMWSFNLLFAIALSPLIVKVWRMHRIVTASLRMERLRISHFHAWLLTLPIPCLQAILLLVFTFVDPPSQTETFMLDNDSGIQTITCSTESEAFFIAQTAFHTILVSMGCVLAYRSRHLDPKYGEAKQLGFAMYNIAFTFIILVTILRVADVDPTGQVILQAIGILWGTLFSAFAFVLPRLIEVERATASRQTRSTVSKFLKQTADWEARVHEISSRFTSSREESRQQLEQAAKMMECAAPASSPRQQHSTSDDNPPRLSSGGARTRRLARNASWSSGYVGRF